MMDHLIAATLFALFSCGAALALRRGKAGWRHGLLLAAILRFAVPTSWLTRIGEAFARHLPATEVSSRALGDITRLLLRSGPVTTAHASEFSASLLQMAECVWALGAISLMMAWIWQMLRKAPRVREIGNYEAELFERSRQVLNVRTAVALRIGSRDKALCVRGFWQPFILLPDGLSEQLREAELQAVIAHELAHVRRRDNLSAALAHSIVCVFWFHPLLWWMERRALAERETACDEMVLTRGTERDDYVAGMLKVCRAAFASETTYAGATGVNLKTRVEQIMSINPNPSSTRIQRAILTGIVSFLAIVPIVRGFTTNGPGVSQQALTRKGAELTGIAIEGLSGTDHGLAVSAIALMLRHSESSPAVSEGRFEKWLNDVAYIITDQESKAFMSLQSDAEREQFIKEFWSRRDPTPGTAENEFKIEHYRRLDYANKHFGSSQLDGWQTDRARFYIILGPPDEIDSHPGKYEQWSYGNFDHSADRLVATFSLAQPVER
jgi:GWxTD domain-containing protein